MYCAEYSKVKAWFFYFSSKNRFSSVESVGATLALGRRWASVWGSLLQQLFRAACSLSPSGGLPFLGLPGFLPRFIGFSIFF
jgi:hypothetical protein